MPLASPGAVKAQEILISVYQLLGKKWIRDAIKMKLCSIIWASWTMLPAGYTSTRQLWEAWGKFGRNERWFKIIVCNCNDESAKPRKRNRHAWMSVKVCAQGWELSFSILSSEPLCLVLKVISCLRCSAFVLPGPPSHIPWPWPLLHTAAQFNLPNAVMGRANQPPERRWGPACHFQLWHMWTHTYWSVMTTLRGDIPVTQPAVVNEAVARLRT